MLQMVYSHPAVLVLEVLLVCSLVILPLSFMSDEAIHGSENEGSESQVLVQNIHIEIDEQVHSALLFQLEEPIPSHLARAKAMQDFDLNASFMFDRKGILLHANQAAAKHIMANGKPNSEHCIAELATDLFPNLAHAGHGLAGFKLRSLLTEHGMLLPNLHVL